MKILKISIENFRSYKDKVTINFDDLTVFVGKNDIGKSTILEALDIFFNSGNGTVKLDKDDINQERKKQGDHDIKISVTFKNFPDSIIIDDTASTSLKEECLLNKNNELEIVKVYPNGSIPKGGKEKVYINANHPTHPECNNLLYKKQKDLQNIITDKNINCDNKKENSQMRKSIWQSYKDKLNLEEVHIDATKEDAKNIWNSLKNYMPIYSLFQSDRKNSDGDNEIQDPMKLAVQEIMKEKYIINALDNIAKQVNKKLQDVADRTCDKLKEMNPDIANTLHPLIPSSDSLKWAEVFKKVSIAGDDDIPINKRGSGVKRLILLNFFRAEADRRKAERDVPDVIYAIEEPETSQHPSHQESLIKALIELSNADHTQIVLTTHSPSLVKQLSFENLRLVKSTNEKKEIEAVEESKLPYPSLNEVNFTAFNDFSIEYHIELYGFMESNEWIKEYKLGKKEFPYIEVRGDKHTPKSHILSTYIRHQIHHPENTLNTRHTPEEFLKSLYDMREFINNKKTTTQDQQVA